MADVTKLIWLPVMNLYCFCEIAKSSAKGAGCGALAGAVGLAAIKAFPTCMLTTIATALLLIGK